MECAKYRVREEKFQDQRLIAEWGKEQGGRTGEERKSGMRHKENK